MTSFFRAGATALLALFIAIIGVAPAQAVDTADREAVAATFESEVIQPIAAVPADPGWTGSLHPTCEVGSVDPSLPAAALSQINWFRDMTGSDPLSFDPHLDELAGEAALMLAANLDDVGGGQNPHQPPPSWDCYTTEGDEGAGRANLAAGVDSLLAVDAIRLMNDQGANNSRVAHRQWMLLPQVRPIGYGAIGGTTDSQATSAVVLIPENRTPPTNQFIAWPTAGYVPMHVTPFRWSLAYHSSSDADFSGAAVSMTYDGTQVPVEVVNRGTAALGPQIVWDFDPGEVIPGPSHEKCGGHSFFCGGGFGEGLAVDATDGDIPIEVNVTGIQIDGQPVDHCYRVIVFDPDLAEPGLPRFEGPCQPGDDGDPGDPGDPGGPDFIDVDGIFASDIEWLASEGITRGCNPPDNTMFCPHDPVTRGQMAAFLVRALHLTQDGPTFTDTTGHIFQGDISRLAAADITRGCNPPDNDRFCPDDPVTRGQMAAFLVRALDLTTDGPTFTDTTGHIFQGDISRLAAADITRGCNPPDNTMFCPDDPVTRAQMAAFLHRALG